MKFDCFHSFRRIFTGCCSSSFSLHGVFPAHERLELQRMGPRRSIQDGGRGGEDGDGRVLDRLGVPSHLTDLGANAALARPCAWRCRFCLPAGLLHH